MTVSKWRKKAFKIKLSLYSNPVFELMLRYN